MWGCAAIAAEPWAQVLAGPPAVIPWRGAAASEVASAIQAPGWPGLFWPPPQIAKG